MPIETGQAAELPKQAWQQGAATHLLAKIRVATLTVTIAADALENSQYYLGEYASNSIMLPSSKLYNAAITGVTNLKIGILEDMDAGIPAIDDDALRGSLSIASAGNKNIFSDAMALLTAQPLWKRLGYPNDPRKSIKLYATLGNDASAGGDVVFQFHFAHE